MDSVDIVCHSMGGIVTRAAYKFGAPMKRTAYIASHILAILWHILDSIHKLVQQMHRDSMNLLKN
jgi:hypothetical protein